MKALIAGGAGFIGSHLADALLAQNYEVISVDNFFIGTRKNIEHQKGNSRFTFYERDLCDLAALDDIFRTEQIDYVYHLAANSDIQASARNPEIEYRNTYTTTFNLLECMRRYDVKRLFFSSTSAVYGDMLGAELSEESCPLIPISYYGGAKLGAEAMISAYAFMNEMRVLVFRFPNVIGPRLTHGVVFDFIKRLRNDPSRLRILGDGRQSKPYLHVQDLVEGILRLRDAPRGVSLYNIGVETCTTVTRIAQIVTEKMDLAGIPFDYSGGEVGWKGDVPSFSYDLTKIHATGWRASMTSDEAVARTVEQELECRP